MVEDRNLLRSIETQILRCILPHRQYMNPFRLTMPAKDTRKTIGGRGSWQESSREDSAKMNKGCQKSGKTRSRNTRQWYHCPQDTSRYNISISPYFLPWALTAALVTLPAFSTLVTPLITPTIIKISKVEYHMAKHLYTYQRRSASCHEPQNDQEVDNR